MKHPIFLILFCLFFNIYPILADDTDTAASDFKTPLNLGVELYKGSAVKLDCKSLVNLQAALQDANVLALCNEAQLACIRRALIIKLINEGKKQIAAGKTIPNETVISLKNAYYLANGNSLLKLWGCAAGMHMTQLNAANLFDQSGLANQ
jgi:hypothetical protein